MRFHADGFKLITKRKYSDKPIVFSAISDPRADSPRSIRSLKMLKTKILAARSSFILILGMTKSQDENKVILNTIGKDIPIMVLASSKSKLKQLRTTLSQHGSHIVDLSLIRLIDFPSFRLLSIPGSETQTLENDSKCRYHASDLQTLHKQIKDYEHKPTLVAAYQPPLFATVDLADGLHLGSPSLYRFLVKLAPLGILFGSVRESQNAAYTLDRKPVEAFQWTNSLALNVGSADGLAMPYRKGWLRSQALIIEIRSNKIRFRVAAVK